MKKLITLAVVVVLVIIGFFVFTKEKPSALEIKFVGDTPCVEGDTEVRSLNIYTCINGEYIYTGNAYDIKG